MSELGGFELFQPSESAGSASEALSEAAKERFAAAAAQMKQAAREERRSRKRDDRVARTIIQFLHNQEHTHLFLLISRLVARDCPSIFILSILSLIHQQSLETVNEYIAENRVQIETPLDSSQAITNKSLSPEMNEELINWITRMQLVMSIDGEKILTRLIVDEHSIDGTVLQLTTFVLVEFFETHGKPIPFDQLQPLTVSILQTIIEPHTEHIERFVEQKREEERRKEEDD